MKKFSFGLETLLQYRMTIEDKERLALSRLMIQLQTEVKERDRLRAKREATMAERSRMRSELENDSDDHWYNMYLDRLEFLIKESGARIGQIQRELDAQKIVVINASKDTKVLDTLKTRKAREYNAAADKIEQKAVDEIVVTRYATKESGR